MRTSAALRASSHTDLYSVAEIAQAAGVSVAAARAARRDGGSPYVTQREAIRLVRALKGSALAPQAPETPEAERLPLTIIKQTRRRQGVPLVCSGAMHAGFVLMLLLVTSGIFQATETEQQIVEPKPVRLVYFIQPGPGGGGGGGGLKMPELPARAKRRVVKVVHKENSPVPPVRKTPPPPPPIEPPKPVEPPKIEPPKIEPPKVEPPKPEPPRSEPPQTVQAPAAPRPADQTNAPGVLNQPPAAVASAGPGTGGGVGTGSGTGVGEGRGGGIGPGSGGGTGGGPFRAGTGIEPPTLLREVKPLYTDEARRRSIEGDVMLEIVVRRDGSVGGMRVIHKLGAGLDEKAMEAVRQWRFAPARRLGAPVDVIAEVSVEFSLR